MTITLELSPELQAKLQESISCGDAAAAQRVLSEAFAPTVAALLAETPPPLSDAEFEALADELADHHEACAGDGATFLSDEAISREGIYGDHP
jgi:antitoxin ParD1/3/4